MYYKKSLMTAGAIFIGFSPLLAETTDTILAMDTQAYLTPLAESLKPVVKLSRWTRARDAFLRLTEKDKDPAIGGGEAEFVFPFAFAGVELKKKGDNVLGDQYIKAAMDTLKGFNKIGDNPAKFSVPKNMNGGSIGQIGFVLPQVTSAAQLLYQNGYLKGEELDRTNKMLKVIADHWLENSPQVGMQGMSNWNNRHGLGPLRVANFLELQKKNDPDTVKKIKAYRRYALAVLLRGADYPYNYKRLPDGKIAPAVKISGREQKETPAPAGRTPRFGITENSSGYNSDSVFNFLNLVSEMPKSEAVPLDDKRMKELCEWIKGWQSLVTPDGAVPSYCDDTWGSSVGWIMVFEKAAVMFADRAKYGDAAAGFKATAQAINKYQQEHCSGLFNTKLAECLLASGYSGEAKRAKETSKIIERQNPHGEMQPAAIILRGDDRNQAFTLFQTFHNGSHSHGDIGCLAAHSVNGKVMQHEAGYDAGEIYFHQQVLIRPANEEFIPFAQVFKDPKKTVISKGNKNLPGGVHQYRTVSLKDTPGYAYTQIITNFRTSFPKQKLNRVNFKVKRQAVLDKKSGALIVLDSVINDCNIKVPVAFSPLWHVQNVLQKTADGFVCSDDNQAEALRVKVKIGKPTGPFWIGMKGPDGFVPEQLTWKFIGRNIREDVTQKEHLYLKGTKTFTARNEAAGMVTVFMPLDKAEITKAPAQISLKNDTAEVTLADTRYTISPDGVRAVPK